MQERYLKSANCSGEGRRAEYCGEMSKDNGLEEWRRKVENGEQRRAEVEEAKIHDGL